MVTFLTGHSPKQATAYKLDSAVSIYEYVETFMQAGARALR